MTAKTIAYVKGWKACEAGHNRGDNPYLKSGTQTQRIDWFIGFDARGEKGFHANRPVLSPSKGRRQEQGQ